MAFLAQSVACSLGNGFCLNVNTGKQGESLQNKIKQIESNSEMLDVSFGSKYSEFQKSITCDNFPRIHY